MHEMKRHRCFLIFIFQTETLLCRGMETITLTMKGQKRVLDYLTGMREVAKIDSRESSELLSTAVDS